MNLAHDITGPEAVWSARSLDPGVATLLGIGLVLYLVGLVALRRVSSRVPARRVAAWVVGLAVCVMALGGPLDAAAHDLFSAHMVQHLVLMLIVAPLLVAGRPGRVLGALVTRSARASFTRLSRAAVVRRARSPLVVGIATAAALGIWHVPAMYDAALTSDPVHAIEHASFLGAAFAFWAVVLGRRGIGTRAALTFAVFLFSGGLGALLTFSGRRFYSSHGLGPQAWGLTPVADQQLAGVIMWIPSGAVYVISFAILFVAWMRRLEARMPSRPPGSGEVVDV